MELDFNNKTFRVVINEGPGAEVNTDTYFYFKQEGNVIHADYFGGLVKVGKLLGVIDGNRVQHSYIQVNTAGKFRSGHGNDELRLTPEGKIQLVDSWEWEDGSGRGECIMEEI